MKKRNRKYKPMQVMKQKVHKFQMTWEMGEAARIIDMHHLLNGVPSLESEFTPLRVWMKAHKGDLALALKLNVIPLKQSFHMVSRVHAVHAESGETIDCDFQMASPEAMNLNQFLNEDENQKFYWTDGGFKKRWRGFNYELEKYLASLGGDKEFIIKTNHCCLTCFTSFLSFSHEREFIGVKLSGGYGLGAVQ